MRESRMSLRAWAISKHKPTYGYQSILPPPIGRELLSDYEQGFVGATGKPQIFRSW